MQDFAWSRKGRCILCQCKCKVCWWCKCFMVLWGTTKSPGWIRLSLSWKKFSCKRCNQDFCRSHKSSMSFSSRSKNHFLGPRKRYCLQLKWIESCKLSKFRTVCNQLRPRNCCMGKTFSIQFHKLFRKSKLPLPYIRFFDLPRC
jgi:hypothetical protein